MADTTTNTKTMTPSVIIDAINDVQDKYTRGKLEMLVLVKKLGVPDTSTFFDEIIGDLLKLKAKIKS